MIYYHDQSDTTIKNSVTTSNWDYFSDSNPTGCKPTCEWSYNNTELLYPTESLLYPTNYMPSGKIWLEDGHITFSSPT